MYKIPINELKEKLCHGANISEAQLEEKIKTKINELSGLISEEGAAHIIANELGVTLVEDKKRLKIKEVYAGMRGIEVLGKVTAKTDIREFQKGDRKGKVANITLGDETGSMRLVCWGDQTELINKVKEGDLILVKSAFVKENNFNQKEIHLNEKTEVEINPEGESVGEVRPGNSFHRKKIDELNEGMNQVEVLGTVVQVINPRFFNVCPECGKRVTETEAGFECRDHGNVTADNSYVMNVILDDGSGTIRGVFWKNQTNNLLGKTDQDMAKYKENPSSFEDVKTDLLGEQYRVLGRVSHNEMFERLELNAQMVFKADAEEEIKRLEG